MNKYLIKTYGCQMNVHDSEKIAGQIESLGYTETHDMLEADIIVFNTCSIRENAVDKAFGNIGALKSMKREHPEKIICVGGCMTQVGKDAEKVKDTFKFVDIIFGTFNLHELKEMIKEKQHSKKRIFNVPCESKEIIEDMEISRTSFPNAWVNIMFGCNNFCTYCIVPYVRGRERSRKIEDIKKEVETLLKDGYKEITLLGQNVDSYGNDFKNPEINFAVLMEELAKLPYKYRLRFMTSHPKDFSKSVVDVMKKYDNISSYIHLPVQAGSNKVLKAMNRKYTREDYLSQIEMIRAEIPNVGITSDIMVGFPGETEEDFLETVSLVEKVKYDTAFTFVYSVRKGTPAASMENQIPDKIQSERIERLIAVQNKISKEIADSYIGKTVEVLCEDSRGNGHHCGRTDNGKMVVFYTEREDLIGKMVNIKITGTTISQLKGEIESVEE
ncbi:MAG: tRNA (N6-isopentenyl adenosine(37)-C2)-methylthiotransferase MiaB [Bacillota bacterium]